MAKQTAAREMPFNQSVAHLPVLASAAAQNYYRGAAIGILNQGAAGIGNASYAAPGGSVMDGTVHVIFAGVCLRDVVTTAAQLEIPVKRDGMVTFNAVDAAGAATVPTQVWVGKPVYFHTDNEVSIFPPAQAYPILAGRVAAINGMMGYGRVGAGEVAVIIDNAVGIPPQAWSWQPLCVAEVGAIAKSGNADYLVATAFARRRFVRRITVQCGLAVDGGATLALHCTIAAVAGGEGPGLAVTTAAITGTVGSLDSQAINTVVDYNDTLLINIEETGGGEPTVGLFLIGMEYMDLL